MTVGLPLGLLRAAVTRPKLSVLVVLEQINGDILEGIYPQFAQNGLRKLLSKGSHFLNCFHLASTFPASSLATLATGAWPSQHGIVADKWIEKGQSVPASAEALLATTLASQIVSAEKTRAHVIGMNATQTALFAGTSKAHQYFRNPRGQWTALGEPPSWLATFNAAKSIEGAYNAKWMAIDPRPGAPPLRTLSYDPDRPAEFLTLYQGSPQGQESQFDFLAELIDKEKLGQDYTDFVCLIAGASSVLGYETGGRHLLQRQLLLHLDRNIEALMAKLSKAPGDANFAFIVAGAHGAPHLPEEDEPSRAVNGETVAQTVDKGLTDAGAGRVRRYLYPFLYLNPIATRDPEAVRVAAGRAALDHPAVAGFYTAGGACSVHGDWERRFRNSFHLKRSGDVMLSYRPEFVEQYGDGRGASYGSLYNYDARVPLCFYGPQFKAGVFEGAVESIDVAPTIARLLGADPPSSSVGRVLVEAFTA
jgi:hypothetical protein